MIETVLPHLARSGAALLVLLLAAGAASGDGPSEPQPGSRSASSAPPPVRPVESPADGAPAAPGEPTLTETVTVVAARFEQPVREVAGAVGRVERLAIERRQAQDIADVLRDEPGVAVVRDAGRFGLGGLRIRGVEGNRVALEVDGVPVPDGFAIGSFSNAGRELVAVEAVDHVEILRGPASAAYGSDALGGVVHLVTRDPADLLAGGERSAFELRADADGRDDGLRTSALAAAQGGRWRLLALASRRAGDERDNRSDVPPNPAATRRTTGLVKLVGLLEQGWLTLAIDGQRGRVETDVRHLIGGPGQFATTTRLLADDRSEHLRSSLALVLDSARAWRSEAIARVHAYQGALEQESSQWRGTDPRTPHPTRRERQFRFDTDELGAAFAVRSRLTTGRLGHDLAWGAEASRTRITELRDGVQIDLETGARTSIVLGESLPVRDFPRSEAVELGAYLIDSIAVGAGRWRLLPALRFDLYRTRARPDALFREDNPDTEVVDTDDRRLTPKLGLVCALTARQSLYLQAAEGFRAPPVYDVNVGFTIPSLGYEALPNPALRPERSRGVELGWRLAAPRASAHASFYDNRYRDLIESRANLGRDPRTGTITFQSVNRDRAHIVGVEAQLRLLLAGRLEGWSLDLAAAWARGRDTRRDVPLNSVDPPKLSLGTRYSGAGERWSAELLLTLVDGKQGEVDASTADLFAPPGYALLDLFASWRVSRAITLRAALTNALDRAYWSYGGVRGVLEGDPLLDFYSEPGRAIQLGVALHL